MKTRFSKLPAFLLLALLSPAAALGSSDSSMERQLQHWYNRMSDFAYSDIDSSEYYARKLLRDSRKFGDSLWVAEAYTGLGYAHFYRHRPQMALFYFRKTEEIFLSQNDTIGLAYAYMDLGNAATALGRYREGIKYYLLSEQMWPQTSEYVGSRAYVYYNLAHTFLDFDDYENAKAYLKVSRELAEADSLRDLFPAINNMRADISLNDGKVEEARKNASKALSQSKAVDDVVEEIYALELLAKCESLDGKMDTAIELQQKSVELAQEFGDPYVELMAYVTMSDIYRKAGQPRQALSMARQADALLADVRSWVAQRTTAMALSKALGATGNYKEALEALQLHTAYTDSLAKINISENILRQQKELIEQSNEELTEQTTYQSHLINRNRTVLVILAIALLLSSAAIGFAILNIRRKKTANRALKQNQKLLDEKSLQLEKSYEELENLNRGKDKLLSIMSHDIRQPFNQTLGVLEILKQYIQDNPELEALIKEVSLSVENDKRSVENLLIWSKSQFATLQAHPEAVEIAALIKRIAGELQQSIREKHIDLNIEIEENARAYGDPNHLEIIFRNLMTNAIKFSENGGKLEVKCRPMGENMEISVHDEGVGMTKKEVDQLFDPQNQFTRKGTLNEAGTGLGLLLVQDFVKENHGNIEVESQPGEGSVFRIILPLAKDTGR